MSRQERQLDAAEYVIGTLSTVERAAFEISVDSDKETKSDVAFWEKAFGSLSATIAPEKPPEELWAKIESAINSETGIETGNETSISAIPDQTQNVNPPVPNVAANDNSMERLKKSVGRWRFGAIAASLAALLLGGYVANQQYGFAPSLQQKTTPVAGLEKGKEYIAVVNANGDQPSLVINIDAKSGAVTVRSVGVERPQGKSLELWYVPEGQKAVSVGLVGEGGIDLKDIPANKGDLLAISLEPQGGSPTGTATGPIIYTGKLIESTSVPNQ